MSGGRAALEAALGLAMPSAAQTAILRAALLDGDPGRRAFELFARTGDPRRLRPEAKRWLRELGPLLERARRRHEAELADRALKTMLRAAAQRESLRWQSYEAAITEIAEALTDAGVVPLLSGGAAVAWSAYPDPSLRHCHDLDLVMEPSDQGAAALSALCSAPLAAIAAGGGRHATHRSGLRLRLHDAMLPEPWAKAMPLEDLRARARRRRIGRVDCLLPSIGDLLVLVCVHALAGRPRHSLRWAADALLLTRAADGSDWERTGELAAASGLAPLLATSLRYLVAELDAMVPPGAGAGASPDAAHREQLLAWALRSRERRPRPADCAGVIATLRWAIWPSASYLNLSGQRSRAARLLRWSRDRVVSASRQLRT